MQETKLQEIKLALAGEAGVGKTCMLISYTTNSFPAVYLPKTIDDYDVNVNVNGAPTKLRLRDVRGGADYKEIRPWALSGADVILLCFAVDSIDSFCETRTWMQQLRNMRRIDNRKNVNARTLHGKVPVILVGTKSDKRLDAMDRTHKGSFISSFRAESFARELGCEKYMECSALTQEGLKKVFDEAIIAARNFIKEKEAREKAKKCCVIL
mmetsp:Transcript_34364/g.47876  ORF Transcript_34364/g.47876 Transcript_34364/m.47876 type:complete len:211 (+) Transcript_34364:128-760(+)